MDILQQLYNSEINFSVSCEWDAGFDFKLGDEYNGFGLDIKNFRKFEDGVKWLQERAIAKYPDSVFAKSRD